MVRKNILCALNKSHYNSLISTITFDKFINHIEEILIAIRAIRSTELHSKHLANKTDFTAPQILLLEAIRDKGGILSMSLPTR